METNENKFTESESINVILNMIQTAKTSLRDDSFYYLFWGWLVFFASLSQYIMLQSDINPEKSSYVWLLMPLGGIITAIYSSIKRKQKKVRTYFDEFMKYVLVAFLVSMAIVIFSMQKLELNTYPMILLIYGIWLYISGGALQFKPLMAGGIVNWILAVASMFVDFKMQLLFLSLAVLLGYIIPGYLLKRKQQQYV